MASFVPARYPIRHGPILRPGNHGCAAIGLDLFMPFGILAFIGKKRADVGKFKQYGSYGGAGVPKYESVGHTKGRDETVQDAKVGRMKTNALHRAAQAAPQRATARDSRGLSDTRLSHHDAANQDEAHPAQRRHDVEAFGGTAEPTLVDVLNEPIVASMMRRDGVALAALQGFMGNARAAVRARRSQD